MTADLSRELIQAGFHEVQIRNEHQIVIAATAKEKSGKTHFALSFPKPIAVLSWDTGTKPIVEKFVSQGERIYPSYFEAPSLEDMTQAEAKKEWQRAKDAFKSIIQSKVIRTLMTDTATELWDLCRLARFGKLTQVMPHHYVEVNAEFKSLIKSIYDRPSLNAVLLHKVKKEYKTSANGKDNWTGRMERAGFSDMPFLVDINIENYYNQNTKEFGIRVLDSRYNMDQVAGNEYEGFMCNFQYLAADAMPEVPAEYWGF